MSEIYVKQEHLKILPQADALLFDVDGVILDVSGSFRVTIVRTVQLYATHVLKWEDTGQLLELDEIDLFKMAGGFNSDWDLTCTAVAFLVAKHCQSGATDTAAIRAQSPSWQEYTSEIKRLGGGFVNAEKYLLEMLTPPQRRNFAVMLNPKLVTQLFQEMYAGEEDCYPLYGFHPQHLHDDGLYKNEKVLLDAKLIPPKMKVGLLTGRTSSETRLAMQMAGLEIAEKTWVTEDHGVRKPDGRALAKLHDAMKFKFGIFVGDTMDDLSVVKNYREMGGITHAKVLSCIVLPGGETHRRAFLEAGADIVADDVNQFLEFFGQVRNAK
jgi:HAD superfamily hydrolase (TIGR01548 family)